MCAHVIGVCALYYVHDIYAHTQIFAAFRCICVDLCRHAYIMYTDVRVAVQVRWRRFEMWICRETQLYI